LLATRNRYGFMVSNTNHKAENPLTALPWQRHNRDEHRLLFIKILFIRFCGMRVCSETVALLL
jgi:hypothetical protein